MRVFFYFHFFFFFLALKDVSVEELEVSVRASIEQYIGVKKGIQSHQNSSYVDSTLFGLFALSTEFDDIFLLKDDTSFSVISNTLWKNIVNPLRK